MSHSIEQEGATVEEAVNEALRRHRYERRQVEVEIVREPSRGFLGLGCRDGSY